MDIRTTTHMLLIYGAILCYLIGFLAVMENLLFLGLNRLMRRSRSASAQAANRRLAALLYLMGFLFAVAAFAVRWKQLDHIPLQSMFDIFLAMGMAIYPITFFCRRLGARAEPVDMLIGVVLLVPAAFVFPDAAPKLPPALQSFLFGPHVATYLLGYVVMTKAAVNALCFLVLGKSRLHQVLVSTPKGWVRSPITQTRDSHLFSSSLTAAAADPQSKIQNPKSEIDSPLCESELPVYRLVCLGLPLLTLGLLMGSWWGQMAWGDYWGWDPKEMWSLATWLIFVLYFHVRAAWPDRTKLRSFIVLLGFTAIVCTMLWVNLSRLFPSLHSYAS